VFPKDVVRKISHGYHEPARTLYVSYKRALINIKQTVSTIGLVLIEQQSLGKRSLRLMKTVNAKKRYPII
jgi:hypothetical protein